MDYLKHNKQEEANASFVRKLFIHLLKKRAKVQNHHSLLLKYFMTKYNISGHICDIGAGDGWCIKSYNSKKIKSKTVIDRDNFYEKQLEKDKINFIKGELGEETVKVKDSSFDLIVMNHILEHIVNYQDAVLELKRITSKNGYIFIRVPDVEKVKLKFFNDFTHEKAYTKKSIQRMFESYGFDVITCQNFHFDKFMVSFLLPSFLREKFFSKGSEILLIVKNK